MKELIAIQSKLKAPKSQVNKFGGYKYRSAEDILEAVKPILHETNCILTITDDIIEVAGRVYVKATARLINSEGLIIETSASAREEESKKGMDASQITGAASSYARKYALNGLFCIDDTKDADAVVNIDAIVEKIKQATTTEQLKQIWESFSNNDTPDQVLRKAVVQRGKEIGS